MKKICLTVLSTVCALCAAFGVVALNVQSVSADTAVELSATKIMKSNAEDKMLLATAIKNFENVYEVGYIGLEDVDTISAETTTYYTEITTGETVWTAESIFGEEFLGAGLIVWEIEYDEGEQYVYQAYAKYGTLLEGDVVVNDPETVVLGEQRTTSPTHKENADGFAVLKDNASWGSYYHGYPLGYANGAYWTGVLSDEDSIWTNAAHATSPHQVGFKLKADAVSQLISLGLKSMTFNLTADLACYVVVYLDNEDATAVTGDLVATHQTYSYLQYFNNGSQITVDLQKALAAGGVNFALTPDLTWNTNVMQQTKTTLTNVKFMKMSKAEIDKIASEQAMAAVKNSSNWGTHYHGYPYMTSSDANSVWTNAAKGIGHAGFTWTRDMLNTILTLGYRSITFTVTTAEGAHVAIYFDGAAGVNWISGEAAMEDSGTYYFASGSEVTIDLKAVMENVQQDSNYPTSAIKFVVCDGTNWGGANPQRVTFSAISFDEKFIGEGNQKPAIERANDILKNGTSYASFYHGTVGTATKAENSVTVNLSKGPYSNSGTGFTLKSAVVKSLYLAGVEKLSFKLDVATASYFAVYASGVTNHTYVTGHASSKDEGGDYTFYCTSGSTITVDLVALMANTTFMSNTGEKDGLKFVLTTGESWNLVSASDVITISNIAVEEFTYDNAKKLTIVTTTGDFPGAGKGNLEQDKAVLQSLKDAGFRYLDLSMYGFTATSDYMQADWETKVAELKSYAASLGLTFVQAHSQGGNPLSANQTEVDTLVNYTLRQIEICGKLGIKNIVVHAGTRAGLTKEQCFEQNKAFYDRLVPTAQACGVNVLVENSTVYNNGSNFYLGSAAQMLEFVKYVNHPNFHACWDTGHANCEGDQYDDILALGDELYAIHFADNQGNGDTHHMPYFGTLKIEPVMRALKEIGFDGYFTLECDGSSRTTGKWTGPEELNSLVGATPSALTREQQEKLLYEITVYILRTRGMLAE